ncbi:lysophospholipid acyltransferase family protein [Nocardioides lianchengensis]|uniref:1-acyl-sn-glycerol-3-phosphate acyltransferase n=1 Tax=Nocardioides lianchengensis TaxID=1045774 RepID=A0A1G7B702_9ACTN|nr:lysophospholipid acyltransferase family protein [Nocardioides lianchengensis]NYG10118.1 1-acyl-sn-glycerol-3-phosphate acyltransferase [Nocardioides lianchengensis]SDE22086.1 1-acyl-sn-glycerol-3-phosphate acyltransferase [Nocardioides lianchengensis]
MSDHGSLPRSDRTRFPWRFMLHGLRPISGWLIRRRYDVRLHGLDLVPAEGPVLFAANHTGVMDGPLLAVYAPRPVHVFTKEEMFDGPLGTFLVLSGQIRLDRFNTDPRAVRQMLRVLRDGAAGGIFPEGRRGSGELDRFHRGTAYLAMVAGASVVPVVMIGTREPGGRSGSLPPKGATIDIVFGAPYTVPAVEWPRTKEQVEHTSMLLREHLLVHLDHAKALTGRELPGELPPGDLDPDPATGVTDQGAP